MKFDRRLTDEIYTSDTVRLGKNAFQAMQETIYHNGLKCIFSQPYYLFLSSLSISSAKVRLFFRINKLFCNKMINYNIFIG